MKRLLLIVFLLIALPVQAQDASVVRNDGAADDVGSGNGFSSAISVDSKGRIFTSPSGTPLPVSGTVNVVATPGATSFLKNEDAAHTTGDNGVFGLSVRNETPSTIAGTELDYNGIATNRYGDIYVSVNGARNLNTGPDLLKPEDAGYANGYYGVLSFGVRQDTLAVDQSADADIANMKLDPVGRLMTNSFGAPVGEWWQACSSAQTGTSEETIKALVASNRIYVSQWTCVNTGAAASRILLRNGAGGSAIAHGMLAATTGFFTETFPVPLRTDSGVALIFQPSTTSTSTTCCANGYISVN